jgi:hypothetical protein
MFYFSNTFNFCVLIGMAEDMEPNLLVQTREEILLNLTKSSCVPTLKLYSEPLDQQIVSDMYSKIIMMNEIKLDILLCISASTKNQTFLSFSTFLQVFTKKFTKHQPNTNN